jgi:hypothetical protein
MCGCLDLRGKLPGLPGPDAEMSKTTTLSLTTVIVRYLEEFSHIVRALKISSFCNSYLSLV